MIKLIMFDLVGVLVYEKNIKLTLAEEKIERMFGPNLNDSDYLLPLKNTLKKNHY